MCTVKPKPLYTFHLFYVVEIINGIMGKIQFTFTVDKSQKIVKELKETKEKVKPKYQ